MKLETGKTYLINHSRKGVFVMRVDRQRGAWAHGIIVAGKANARLDYNEKLVGDRVDIRIDLLNSAVEQP